MADQMTTAERGAVADRICDPLPVESPPVSYRPPVSDHTESVAVIAAGHIRAGDAGAVRRLVHEIEHGLGPWSVEPWRLIEHMAEHLARGR
jgi:hypothetical protein